MQDDVKVLDGARRQSGVQLGAVKPLQVRGRKVRQPHVAQGGYDVLVDKHLV